MEQNAPSNPDPPESSNPERPRDLVDQNWVEQNWVEQHYPGPRWMWFCCGLVPLILGYFIFVDNYTQPEQALWDESYFIVSTQRYLDGVMFMESHPPLGKLLFALGEYLLQPNATRALHQLTAKETISELPPGYSFAGIRLMPVLFAWVSVMLFFALCGALTRSPIPALVCTLPYLFQNALIVHFRAAMLDGMQISFILAALLVFVLNWQRATPRASTNIGTITGASSRFGAFAALGFWLGCAMSIKVNAVVFLALPVLLAIKLGKEVLTSSDVNVAAKRLGGQLILAGIGFVIPVCSAWYLHFSIANTVRGQEYYGASDAYKQILADAATASPLHFPRMLADSIAFSIEYNQKVPRADLTNPHENGSYPLQWIFGGKAIKYGWKKVAEDFTRYYYAVANPLAWWFGTLSIALSICLLVGTTLFRTPIEEPVSHSLLAILAGLYLSYLAMVSQLDRALYLYHYFIPLVVSLLCGAALFRYLYGRDYLSNQTQLNFALGFFALQITAAFLYFSCFTYGTPITHHDVIKRQWHYLWNVEPLR